jgi:hypothetical protein
MCVNKYVSKNGHKEVNNTKVCLLVFYKIAKMVVFSQLSGILIVTLKYIIFKELQSFNVSRVALYQQKFILHFLKL